MRRQTLCIGIALFFCSTLSYAQQGLIGSYEGSFRHPDPGHGPRQVGSTLEIKSAENGKLAGKFKISNEYCMGEYLIQGTYNENKLEMWTGEGTKRDCGKELLVLVVQGNKLIGTIGSTRIEMEKK